MKVYQRIAHLIQATRNCESSGNTAWGAKHGEMLERIARECLPSGSGFDRGTSIDLPKCSRNRIVLQTSFRHMNDGGMYCGWTDHNVIVTPDLLFDFNARVTGRNARDIKEYISGEFEYALNEDCPDWAE